MSVLVLDLLFFPYIYAIRSTSKTFANNRMEYFCHFQEISSWGCLCVSKVFESVILDSFFSCVHCVLEGWPIGLLWYIFFHRGENGELRVGVRRLTRQQSTMPSSVISSTSMHLGVLATASHAVTTQTLFVVYYKPRFVWLLVRLDALYLIYFSN